MYRDYYSGNVITEPLTRFWMVIRGVVQGSQTCVCRHATFAEAEAEAIRLCKKESATFFILEAIEAVEAMVLASLTRLP
jgi:hypothetical protein